MKLKNMIFVNLDRMMKLKTNKTSKKGQDQKIKIKRIRIEVKTPIAKTVKLYFLGEEIEKKEKQAHPVTNRTTIKDMYCTIKKRTQRRF